MRKNIATAFLPMIDAMQAALGETLREAFGKPEIRDIIAASRIHFKKAERLLPDVGSDSPWLKNLIGITYEIGLWKELRKREMGLNEISVATQKMLARLSQKTAQPDMLAKIRSTMCSPAYVKRIAEASRKRPYPDDWVFDCVLPGETDEFEVGMDIHTCPVALLCKRLDTEAFFPYFCLNDYVIHGMLGITLVRTQTLAHGASCCDFRLTPAEKPFANIITNPAKLAEFRYR